MKQLKPLQCQFLSEKFVLHETEQLGNQQMFGIELEYQYAPDTEKIACIAMLIREQMITLDELRQQTLLSYGNGASFIQMEPMKVDGENDELILYPMTMLAAKSLKSHFETLFLALHKQGYEPWGPLNEIGMHISVERSMINSATLTRISWWLLRNNELFVYLSGRKNWSTCRADIRFMLGDKYRRWTKSELENRAKEQFEILATSFDYKYNADIVGIRTYQNRPFVQFTQFGSTLKVESFYTKIEFIDWLLNWCADKEDNDPHHFIESVTQSKYPYLYDTLKSLGL
jgi:hypothetical protein